MERTRRPDPQPLRTRPKSVRLQRRLGSCRGGRAGTVAIGTETDGSIICPASMNGIVGIKPTLGLVSRRGIVPISHNQDTAGPMARNVTDAAALLSVIAGTDSRDPATVDADKHATDYTRYLDPNGLKGKRIGVVRQLAGAEPNADRALERAIAVMKAQGAIIIDPVEIPHLSDLGSPEITVLLYDFKHDIEAYLAERTGLKVRTLADLIAFNKKHAGEEMPWFGQELFEQAEQKGALADTAYKAALRKAKLLSGPQGIDAALGSRASRCAAGTVMGTGFHDRPGAGRPYRQWRSDRRRCVTAGSGGRVPVDYRTGWLRAWPARGHRDVRCPLE